MFWLQVPYVWCISAHFTCVFLLNGVESKLFHCARALWCVRGMRSQICPQKKRNNRPRIIFMLICRESVEWTKASRLFQRAQSITGHAGPNPIIWLCSMRGRFLGASLIESPHTTRFCSILKWYMFVNKWTICSVCMASQVVFFIYASTAGWKGSHMHTCTQGQGTYNIYKTHCVVSRNDLTRRAHLDVSAAVGLPARRARARFVPPLTMVICFFFWRAR